MCENDTTGSVTLMETGELNRRRADRLDGFFRIGKIVAKRQTSNRLEKSGRHDECESKQ